MPWYLETDRTDNNGKKKANCYLWTSGKVRDRRWVDIFVFDDHSTVRQTSALVSYLEYNCTPVTNADVPLQVEQAMTQYVLSWRPELVLNANDTVWDRVVLVYTPFKTEKAAVFQVRNFNLAADLDPWKTGRDAVKLFEGSEEQAFGFALGLGRLGISVKTATCLANGDITNYAWTASTPHELIYGRPMTLDLNASSPVKQFQLIG